MEGQVYFGDNLLLLKKIPDNSVDLIWTDPPFNTNKIQKRKKVKCTTTVSNPAFSDYNREYVGEYGSYNDKFDDYLGFLVLRLKECYRVLKENGSMYLHLNYREVHYAKVEMDKIFGRDNFINEIIWCHEFGAKSKTRWSAKHDNILYYVKDKNNYTFNYDKIPRIPYLAPKLVGPEKAARGKIVVDWWRETVVPTNSKEKQGYATQKPLRILNRIVEVSSNPGDLCMDFFAGSGSFGEACFENNRKCILMDNNLEAIEIMKKRFNKYNICFEEENNFL